MKKLIVYITICCLLFTSCATISNVKPNQNSTKLFSIIEENAKDQKITVELVNGKFYNTTNLYFKEGFLTFVEIDSSKIENVKLDEIQRIVIEKKEISSEKTFRNWIYAGAILGGIFTLVASLGNGGEGTNDNPNSISINSVICDSSVYFFLFFFAVIIGTVSGVIHVIAQQSGNNIIYNFSPKLLK